MISIITPAFNEAQSLNALYTRIVQTMQSLGVEWEWDDWPAPMPVGASH